MRLEDFTQEHIDELPSFRGECGAAYMYSDAVNDALRLLQECVRTRIDQADTGCALSVLQTAIEEADESGNVTMYEEVFRDLQSVVAGLYAQMCYWKIRAITLMKIVCDIDDDTFDKLVDSFGAKNDKEENNGQSET